MVTSPERRSSRYGTDLRTPAISRGLRTALKPLGTTDAGAGGGEALRSITSTGEPSAPVSVTDLDALGLRAAPTAPTPGAGLAAAASVTPPAIGSASPSLS